MKLSSLALFAAALFATVPSIACTPGIYRADAYSFVAVTKSDKGDAYTFSDGTVGKVGDSNARLSCEPSAVRIDGKHTWHKVPVIETNTRFESNGLSLAGRLMELPGANKATPLVVYAHGSEGSGWIDHATDPYQMLGRGVSVFVFDKRGTGMSAGTYTQNFPQLANDLAAAAREARRLADGRFGRFGFVGLSQGGWTAPLAATQVKTDFLGIGYGLAVDIAEEDAEQVDLALRERSYGEDIVALGRKATAITARIVKSAYKDGLDDLAAYQQQYKAQPWYAAINGAYTGVFLSISVAEVRKHGIPFFDGLQVDWSQNPVENLKKIDVPQLWAFAQQDRQAPMAQTVARLSALKKSGKPILMMVFPDAEHGMWQYEQAADFSRKHTRIAPGFYDLMADWAKGTLQDQYGKARAQ